MPHLKVVRERDVRQAAVLRFQREQIEKHERQQALQLSLSLSLIALAAVLAGAFIYINN